MVKEMSEVKPKINGFRNLISGSPKEMAAKFWIKARRDNATRTITQFFRVFKSFSDIKHHKLEIADDIHALKNLPEKLD